MFGRELRPFDVVALIVLGVLAIGAIATGNFEALILLFILAVGVCLAAKAHRDSVRKKAKAWRTAALCVEEHLPELNPYEMSIVSKNSQGGPRETNEASHGSFEELFRMIDARACEEHQRREEKAEFEADMTPYEFEQFCASRLSGAGWNARATQASGDQGADVVAEKDGKVAVFQCKMYSQPVGNKAVQEIVAAKSFHHADYAAVVSNADYTRSARALAQANGVLLLHYHDLDDLGFA
jgi:hypothetical protein